jgi:hypothetical protein
LLSADDRVIRDRIDVAGFSMFFHSFSYFSFGDELHERADKIDLAGITGHDDAHGDDPQREGRHRLDLLISHRKNRDDHHVDGVTQRPALEAINRGANHDDTEKHERTDVQAVHRFPQEKAVGGFAHGAPSPHAPCHLATRTGLNAEFVEVDKCRRKTKQENPGPWL